MEILYIKLKNGTDIISNTSIKGKSVTLEKPMAVRQYSDQSGRISLSFHEWVPSDFVDVTSFVIDKEETLIICDTSVRIKEFYKECLKPVESTDDEDGEEASDAYSSLMKLLNNNRKLLH
jgi:hypothetical protein